MQINWQHWVQKTQNKEKENKKNNTENYKDEQYKHLRKPEVNPGSHEG
jgi:hypothetical protein